MAVIMDGKGLAEKVRKGLKIECDELKKQGISPKLAVIMVGENPASKVYIRNKSKACDEIGIEYEEYFLDENVTQKTLNDLIQKLNQTKDVNGILLQSPLPMHLDINQAFKAISYRKDVDGFTPSSLGKLTIGEDTFISCTPHGVMKILEEYNIDLSGKNVVILGRSNIVGKPLLQCCLAQDATVTVCHSRTKNIEEYTKKADVLISAIGRAKYITKDMVKKGAVVIDVGINRNEEGKLVGDVDYQEVENVASYITPVPGGVGPMTIAMLMSNVLKATKEQNDENSKF